MKKAIYTDAHSHILPGVDHGAESIEASMSLIAGAKKAGISTVAATPHFYPEEESVADFVKRREIGYVALMSELMETHTEMKIIKAAEVYLTPDLPELCGLERLAYEGADKILIELPYTFWGDWVYEALYEISAKRGLTPVIAHIDRYPADFTAKLFEMSFPIQINADAAASRSKLEKYKEHIKDGSICLLGSDAHDAAERNYGNFGKAVSSLCSLKRDFFDKEKDFF